MKRAIIIHCLGGKAQYCWYPWAKAELEKRGYEVQLPDMPDPDEPQLNEWLSRLQELVGSPDEELLLVGHSLGTVTIMRYLEALLAERRVGQTILVAGFTDPLGIPELEDFFRTELAFDRIKQASARGITVINSDDDPYVGPQYGPELEAKLGAELIIKHAAGHMSGELNAPDACTLLPELLDALR